MKLEEYLDYLVEWVKETTISNGQNGVVVGISGGIDSAVVAHIAKRAFPDNHLLVWMPCYSSELDFKSYSELISSDNFNCVTVNLEKTFNALKSDLDGTKIESTPFALSNAKARLRMTTLYNFAQTKKYLVLGTDNAVEWYIGYFTKFGDGGCDLLPISKLLKRDVIEASKILNVPKIIIERKPTASLWESQTDEDEIGFAYSDIDRYMSGEYSDDKLKERIEYLHNISEHKRKSAPMPKEWIKNK